MSALALPGVAQYWPKPAAGADSTCTGCLAPRTNKLTPGYPSTVGSFVGRFLDSQATQDYQQPFRTARAFHIAVAPSKNRIYMIVGSAVFAYDLSTFFTRLQGGEQLAAANTVPIGGSYPWTRQYWDVLLKPDSFFYSENEPNGWKIQITDGQERLFGIDYDDQGYIYMAYSFYGWGIAKDDGSNGFNLMASPYQEVPGTYPDEVFPLRI